jgi:hypothetical protein
MHAGRFAATRMDVFSHEAASGIGDANSGRSKTQQKLGKTEKLGQIT